MRLNIKPDYSRNNCGNCLKQDNCPFIRFDAELRQIVCPYVIDDDNFIDIRELLTDPKKAVIEPFLLRPLQQSQFN